MAIRQILNVLIKIIHIYLYNIQVFAFSHFHIKISVAHAIYINNVRMKSCIALR